MKDQFYGCIQQHAAEDEISRCAEEIAIKGYAIIASLFDPEDLEHWRKKIDEVYETQECQFGRENLAEILELDLCRAPLLYDFEFIKLAAHPRILAVVKHILGDWFILNLQNAVINRPGVRHHQSSWHRDLPYQNFIISQPLAINALLAIDEFSEDTGGTQILPFTHKMERCPSPGYIAGNLVPVRASPGSVILFDSMMFHRAGSNSSQNIRRAVNHLYTVPIIKQQYDFPRALGDQKKFSPELSRLLGFSSQVPVDDREWRHARAARLRARKGEP